MFEEMLYAIGDSLSNLAWCDDEDDGEDKVDDKDDTELGNLSEDDEPSWVTGSIYKSLQQQVEKYLHEKMRLDELTRPGWGDAADYSRER